MSVFLRMLWSTRERPLTQLSGGKRRSWWERFLRGWGGWRNG